MESKLSKMGTVKTETEKVWMTVAGENGPGDVRKQATNTAETIEGGSLGG